MSQLVSIIIPTYNRPTYLEMAIRSVLKQSYQNFEIIIVDDNPHSLVTDSGFFKNDKRIRYFKNEINQGAPFSRNFGVSKAKGEYIAFLDDDDFWAADKLEKQLKHFSRLGSEFGVVYCGFYFTVGESIIKRSNKYYSENDLSNITMERCPFGSPTPLIRKKIFMETDGFDVTLPSCQDWDFWIRITKICKCSPVMEALAFYRIHGEQISTDISKKISGRRAILEKYRYDFSKYPSIISNHYRRIGSLCSLNDQRQKALRSYRLSINEDKFNWSSWFHFLVLNLSHECHKNLVKKFGLKKISGIEIID